MTKIIFIPLLIATEPGSQIIVHQYYYIHPEYGVACLVTENNLLGVLASPDKDCMTIPQEAGLSPEAQHSLYKSCKRSYLPSFNTATSQQFMRNA